MRTIFHLDLDAFFVSVERIIDPTLNGKPVIVGGDPAGRGVVAACSYEARKYGIHSAMPLRQAYKLCRHALFVRGHSGEYSRYSAMVRGHLEKYPPILEQTSIDEMYMDFTGCRAIYGHPLELATRLQREIYEIFSLPCSIGIGTNKTIAKIASDFNKPRGITYVVPGTEKEFLENMPIEALPGVGRVMQPKLNSRGFYKIGDIVKEKQEYFSEAFGKSGIDLYHKALGEGTEFLSPTQERKSISSEHTYDIDIVNKTEIENTLFLLTAKICQSLRNKNRLASTITLKLRYADFITVTRAKSVVFTDDDNTVFTVVRDLFRKNYTRRVAVRLIGVGISNFTPFAIQESLFEDAESKRRNVIGAVNRIRDKYGFGSIDVGVV